MKTKTAADFKKQVQDKNISSWILRQCSVCNAPLEFIFDGDDVFYNANCDCITLRTMPQERSYQDLANLYNYNVEKGRATWIKEINEFFGFNE